MSPPTVEFAAGQLRAAEDAAIRDMVAMQESVGLQSATDGEFCRASWHMDFIHQLAPFLDPVPPGYSIVWPDLLFRLRA